MNTTRIANHNNKLLSNVFISIAPAPETPVMESELPKKVLIEEAGQAGNSIHDQMAGEKVKLLSFEAELIDLKRIKAYELGSIVTYLSHGVSREDFLKGYDLNRDLAIYIYRKCQK